MESADLQKNTVTNLLTIARTGSQWTNNGTMERHDFRLPQTKRTGSIWKHPLLSTVHNRIDKHDNRKQGGARGHRSKPQSSQTIIVMEQKSNPLTVDKRGNPSVYGVNSTQKMCLLVLMAVIFHCPWTKNWNSSHHLFNRKEIGDKSQIWIFLLANKRKCLFWGLIRRFININKV